MVHAASHSLVAACDARELVVLRMDVRACCVCADSGCNVCASIHSVITHLVRLAGSGRDRVSRMGVG